MHHTQRFGGDDPTSNPSLSATPLTHAALAATPSPMGDMHFGAAMALAVVIPQPADIPAQRPVRGRALP